MSDQLFNPDGPAVSVLAETPFEVATRLMNWTPAHSEWDVLRVRGHKSVDEAHFFDEIAAALQFPYYFGENWSAVWDCITDLNWLRGSSFLIVFDSSEYLLSQSDRGFQLLLEVLVKAHHRWHRETADFGPLGRQPISFQSVFACAPDALDAMATRINNTGTSWVLL